MSRRARIVAVCGLAALLTGLVLRTPIGSLLVAGGAVISVALVFVAAKGLREHSAPPR
jgi:hypothetical protein